MKKLTTIIIFVLFVVPPAVGQQPASPISPDAATCDHQQAEFWASVLENFREKPAELLTAIALVVVTVLLWLATRKLVTATKQLDESAIQEQKLRRIESTARAWMEIRWNLEFPDLRSKKDAEIETLGKAARPSIVRLETYAACVNSEVYHIDTFDRISGSWLIQHFCWIKPYIQRHREEHRRRGGNTPPYEELVKLEGALRKRRKLPARPSTF